MTTSRLVVLLLALMLVLGGATAAATLAHRSIPATIPASTESWVASSVPLAAYATASSSDAQDQAGASAFGFTEPSAMPAFTFANPVVSAPGMAASDDPSAQIHSYLSSINPDTAGANGTAGASLAPSITLPEPGASEPTAPSVSAEAPDQIALHAYGNAAGTIVRSLESETSGATDDLDAFFKSPSDGSAAPVAAIAAHLREAGEGIASIASVPTSAQAGNARLAAGYEAAADALMQVSRARGDADLQTSLTAYDAKVQDLGSAFTAIVTLFQAQHVTFSESDPGNEFVFVESQ